jgi:hypothetical protein
LFNAIALRDQRQLASSLRLLAPKEMMPHFDLMRSMGFRINVGCLYWQAGERHDVHCWMKDGGNWTGWGDSLAGIVKLLENDKKNGLRPVSLNTAGPPNALHFSACMGDHHGIMWEHRLTLSASELRDYLAKLKSSGGRPDLVSAYHDGKQNRFMIVSLDEHGATDWDFQMDLPRAAYEQALEQNQQRSLRPQAVCSYLEYGEERYAAIWLRYAPGKSK